MSAMADPRETHYEILGIRPEASPLDIQRVFDRFVADLPRAETPPDPRRERRMRDAYAVLSDPARREAYDALLAAGAAEGAKRSRGIAIAVGSALLMLGAGIYGWRALKSSVKPPTAIAALAVAEIATQAGRALGHVDAYDLSGKVTALGFGAAVEAGTLVVACPTLVAGSQLKVRNGPRAVSALVVHRSESLGLCRLAVEGGGAAAPIAVAPAAPAAGDQVYAATLDAAGEAKLLESTVKRVFTEGARTLIDTTGTGPAMEGAVLLDAAGRVVGVAPVPAPGYYAVPKAFLTEKPAPS